MEFLMSALNKCQYYTHVLGLIACLMQSDKKPGLQLQILVLFLLSANLNDLQAPPDCGDAL